MKVLIISRTPWDNSNSFGNTFSNIFSGMQDVEIYNISCKNGVSNNNVTTKEIQLTDKSVLKSFFKFRYDPCWKVVKGDNLNSANECVSVNAIKKRNLSSFVIRDLIWKVGRWKKSKVLKEFLHIHKPDVLYLPIYASPYMCDFQQYVIKKLGVPVVGHISDDVYNLPPKASFFVKLYRKILQKKITRLIQSCEYLEVFAQNMADEYSQRFDIPCYLIGKGVTQDAINNVPAYAPQNDGKLKITYTGNISSERFSVLYELGRIINAKFNTKAFIDVYTQTQLSDEMKSGFDELKETVNLKGSVSSEKVKEIQRDSDLLLHIEGFSEKSLFEVKMSFSTKIIDYMLTGVPILAIGPKEANSIDVLNNGLACVATSIEEIEPLLAKIFNKQLDMKVIQNNVLTFLEENKNINYIQSMIKERLSSLL